MFRVADVALETSLAAFKLAFDARDRSTGASVEALDADGAFRHVGLSELVLVKFSILMGIFTYADDQFYDFLWCQSDTHLF